MCLTRNVTHQPCGHVRTQLDVCGYKHRYNGILRQGPPYDGDIMTQMLQNCMDQQSSTTMTCPWQCISCNIRDFVDQRKALKESIIQLAQFAIAEMRQDTAIQLRGPVLERYNTVLSTIAEIENCENTHMGSVEPVTMQRVCYLREWVRALIRETEDVLAGRRPTFRMLGQVLNNRALMGV